MNKEQFYNLLVGNDDTEWEFPKGFDFHTADKQFLALLELIKTVANISSFEHGSEIQDASFHGKIIFKMKNSNISFQLRVSNFGKLVTILNLCQALSEEQEVIKSLLADRGYHFLPEEILSENYDGRLDRLKGTWFKRFFDYI
jgi:hypothetical protein